MDRWVDDASTTVPSHSLCGYCQYNADSCRYEPPPPPPAPPRPAPVHPRSRAVSLGCGAASSSAASRVAPFCPSLLPRSTSRASSPPPAPRVSTQPSLSTCRRAGARARRRSRPSRTAEVYRNRRTRAHDVKDVCVFRGCVCGRERCLCVVCQNAAAKRACVCVCVRE